MGLPSAASHTAPPFRRLSAAACRSRALLQAGAPPPWCIPKGTCQPTLVNQVCETGTTPVPAPPANPTVCAAAAAPPQPPPRPRHTAGAGALMPFQGRPCQPTCTHARVWGDARPATACRLRLSACRRISACQSAHQVLCRRTSLSGTAASSSCVSSAPARTQPARTTSRPASAKPPARPPTPPLLSTPPQRRPCRRAGRVRPARAPPRCGGNAALLLCCTAVALPHRPPPAHRHTHPAARPPCAVLLH